MAYQLEYKFLELKKYRVRKRRNIHIIFVSLLLAAAVILAQFGGAALEIIILGRSNHIGSAATQMVAHLQEGMTFDEAVYVFCEEITIDEISN